MKVTVDRELCVGSGQCVLSTAQVFDQRDEDGAVVLLDDEPPWFAPFRCPAVIAGWRNS
ncbi:ferredoxin [Nonomuraea sp. B12E4]|uniref:ferredoxin n=1 Tax=Nonomuraea sp. B12E4 TaxID=3153564 RepID=UPI00325CB6BE